MKKGTQTSEFWVSMGVLFFNALLAMGVIPHGTEVNNAIAAIGTMLVAFGYSWARTMAKKN